MDIYRHLLRLYPKSFRDEYGDALRQAHADLRVHRGMRGIRLFTATTGDLARSATRLRWEEGMAHHPGRTRGVVTVFVTVAFVGLAALGPILAIPTLIGLVIYMSRHRDDIRSASASATIWIGLPVVGAILLLIGAIAGATMSDDSAWWPLAAGPLLIGSVMVVVSLVLMVVHEVRVRLLHRVELVEPRTRAVGAGLSVAILAGLLVAMGESRGWAFFMIVVISGITLAVLGAYALLLHLTRPRGAAAL